MAEQQSLAVTQTINDFTQWVINRYNNPNNGTYNRVKDGFNSATGAVYGGLVQAARRKKGSGLSLLEILKPT